jgi:RNA polymerase sigma-70 factor (ECF subfamily)
MYSKSKLATGKASCQSASNRSIDLIEPEIPHLLRYARSLTRDRDNADDLVQDCLVRAFENIDKWQPGTCMIAWLKTILRNNFYNKCRRTKLERDVQDELMRAAHVLTAPRQEHCQELRDVDAAFDTLSDEHREVIILVAIEGMDYEATSQILDVEVGTVKSRLSRARQELRSRVDRDFGQKIAA